MKNRICRDPREAKVRHTAAKDTAKSADLMTPVG
jgi:hypothetical protein